MEPFCLHHKLHESKELSKVPQESEENTSRLLHIFRRETSSIEVLEKVYGKLDEMQTALVSESPRPENERVWDYTPQRPRKAQSSLLPRRLGVLSPPTQTIYAPPMASDADLYCSHLRYLNEIYARLPVFLCRPPLGSTSSHTYVFGTASKTRAAQGYTVGTSPGGSTISTPCRRLGARGAPRLRRL